MTKNRKYQDPFRGYRRQHDGDGALMELMDEPVVEPREGLGSLMGDGSALVADVMPPMAVVQSPLGAALQGLMGSGLMPEPASERAPKGAASAKVETAPPTAKAGQKKGLAGVLAWLRKPE